MNHLIKQQASRQAVGLLQPVNLFPPSRACHSVMYTRLGSVNTMDTLAGEPRRAMVRRTTDASAPGVAGGRGEG